LEEYETMPRELTLAALKARGACADQRVLFRKLFGRSVLVTPELCAKHAQVFNFHWAARHLLSAPAQAEYERVLHLLGRPRHCRIRHTLTEGA
jgi:hypothetical protein